MPNPRTQTQAPEKKVRKFEGADWLRDFLKRRQPLMMLPEFGERVADLLGDVWYGIYHLPEDKLAEVEWDNPHCITIPIRDELATFDDSKLTNLVILAHDYSLRVAVRPQSQHNVQLIFHPREPGAKEYFKRHPTIDEAVQSCRDYFKV